MMRMTFCCLHCTKRELHKEQTCSKAPLPASSSSQPRKLVVVDVAEQHLHEDNANRREEKHITHRMH